MIKMFMGLNLGICLLSFTLSANADYYEHRDNNVILSINPDTTVLYMKSDITEGHISGFNCGDEVCVDKDGDGFPDNAQTITWSYTGDVYAARVSDDTGEQKGLGERIGSVDGAPAFPARFGMFQMISDPKLVASMLNTETLPWTCNGCNLKIRGSTFAKIDHMPLTGRAFIGLGAVSNLENKLALRMGGCAGIQEISGKGKYANMQGTICLNGTIGFNPDFTGVGTSNCVMVLQTGPYVPTTE